MPELQAFLTGFDDFPGAEDTDQPVLAVHTQM